MNNYQGITCVRKIDVLGRVTIPIRLREFLGAEQMDYLSMYTDGEKIIISKDNNNPMDSRKIDVFGRVVIIKSIREAVGIEIGDLVGIGRIGEEIIIQKLDTRCCICNSKGDLLSLKHAPKKICKRCIKIISRI